MGRWLGRGAALAAAVLLVLMATGVVLGNGLLLDGKVRTGNTVTVTAAETVQGDLYLVGGNVVMDGTVDGDLTALGGQVHVNGTVTGDLLVAGGDISISGKVDGDVRVLGGQLNMAGSSGEDLAVLVGQVTVPAGGSIGGDLIVAGGQVTVSGAVAGSIEGSAGSYSRSGTVGGAEHVVVSPPRATPAAASNAVLDALRQFVVVVLFGALLLWWLPRGTGAADLVLRKRPLLALGAGLLACLGYVLSVIAAIIAMVLLALLFGLLQIGALVAIEIIAGIMSIGLVSFLFVLTFAFVADALVGLALARMAMKTVLPSRWREFGRLAAGAAVVVIITSIPIVGGWVKLVVALLALGAIGVAWWETWRAGRKAPAAGEPGAPVSA
ncbi:MAG: hypothetical protein M3R32_04020 [Chloroflexota bacterium]|nr:hypothetical protein [Chloroflexota bacterium]